MDAKDRHDENVCRAVKAYFLNIVVAVVAVLILFVAVTGIYM